MPSHFKRSEYCLLQEKTTPASLSKRKSYWKTDLRKSQACKLQGQQEPEKLWSCRTLLGQLASLGKAGGPRPALDPPTACSDPWALGSLDSASPGRRRGGGLSRAWGSVSGPGDQLSSSHGKKIRTWAAFRKLLWNGTARLAWELAGLARRGGGGILGSVGTPALRKGRKGEESLLATIQ